MKHEETACLLVRNLYSSRLILFRVYYELECHPIRYARPFFHWNLVDHSNTASVYG